VRCECRQLERLLCTPAEGREGFLCALFGDHGKPAVTGGGGVGFDFRKAKFGLHFRPQTEFIGDSQSGGGLGSGNDCQVSSVVREGSFRKFANERECLLLPARRQRADEMPDRAQVDLPAGPHPTEQALRIALKPRPLPDVIPTFFGQRRELAQHFA
jgi:hypothetical protein